MEQHSHNPKCTTSDQGITPEDEGAVNEHAEAYCSKYRETSK